MLTKITVKGYVFNGEIRFDYIAIQTLTNIDSIDNLRIEGILWPIATPEVK